MESLQWILGRELDRNAAASSLQLGYLQACFPDLSSSQFLLLHRCPQYGLDAPPYLLPQLTDPYCYRVAMGTAFLLRVNLERHQIKMMLTSGLTPEPKIKGPRGWVGFSPDVCHLDPGPHRKAAGSLQTEGTQKPTDQHSSSSDLAGS